MPDAFVLDVPRELSLELTAVVGPEFLDLEWKGPDHVIDEVDGVGLGIPVRDLEPTDAGRVVDGRELEAANLQNDEWAVHRFRYMNPETIGLS